MPIVKPFIAGRRFVSTAATGTVAGADLTFANTDFTDDTGAVTTFPASYAFLTLYINGVIQTGDTITGVTTTAATIVGGAVLDGGTPIAIEFTIT
ncbi:DUF4183 domain-containing protein [Bacillus wiedmannii]|jgi:hypothetical protein|uniref:DUF4183 domain-containing protein n=7 Tax=Bacillus cereus group TaxID=86661 RepID=A0A0B5NP29_BACTU|nr:MULTISPECIES: DUF4183 domain-containing protein [Bacillus]AZJ20690.1 DUF4183 domain-containing protein [Bacillus wiedmannii bv. thuringiensis]PFA47977.1 DUF4183 domain-containing protein [Bacillus anthracis]AHA10613.1 hypothetical protein Btoyo_4745 [Bacillus toyonensis BCT-7112]AJG79574.1 hypothetical protein BF38_5552 [Bacillus thuringiensis]AKE16967.1 hypothetical protein FORC5_2430 [Bacillus cereus]